VAPISLSASDGTVYSTTLWSVDGDRRRIAFTADARSPTIQRLVEADEAQAVGYLDQIKLQFEIHNRVLVHSDRACVLQAAFPREMYRFQRRTAYRVRTLERSSPRAVFRHPALPDVTMELRVLDVAAGGCALLLPPDLPAVAPGSALNGVRIILDQDTEFRTGLSVHHITAIQPDATGVRLGCSFGKLAPEASRALQRYIDNTQKRRRMLALD
jgi:c-di-GMP-binding flagellar brake protein YcgR